MGPGRPKPTRRRNRKRKRRDVSSSSSSSSDTSAQLNEGVTIPQFKPVKTPADSDETDKDDTETSSSSSGDDSQDDSESNGEKIEPTRVPSASKPNTRAEPPLRHDSPSPLANVDIPPFTPSNAPPETEQALKEKFRKFWMASVAEGFKDDLEQIRKEPNLTPSRLALLIESLASGADVFSSSTANGHGNEMEVVLGPTHYRQ